MKNISKLVMIITLITSTLLQGCNLEGESINYDGYNPQLFPKTEGDVKALMIGNVYSTFRNDGYSGMFNIATGVLLVSDLMSDYGECSWRGWADVLYGRWRVGNEFLEKAYNEWANGLSKMTLTEYRIKDVPMSEEAKAQYLAEIQCGRGWLAFSMYDLYGPIPIADIETLLDPLASKIIPRLTEEEMKQYIVNQLTEAAKVLPYNYKKGDSDYGKFTKGLANTILMKFYMMNKEWDKAEALGRELMKPEYGYKLVENYNDIFTLANEKNTETIWAVNCLPGYQEHKWHPHVLPGDYPTDPAHVVKWNGFKMTWDFFRSFDPKDERIERIISEYTGTNGVLHNEEIDVPKEGMLKYGAVPMKYEIDKATTGEGNQIDYIIYRYADVITLLSEAIVRNGGAITQEAIDLLNQVRTRSGLTAYTKDSFTSSVDFINKVLKERAHEFYFEGIRRQDLIRNGTYVEAMKNKCAILGETTSINKNYEKWPLPQTLIDEGKGQIIQNPGY